MVPFSLDGGWTVTVVIDSTYLREDDGKNIYISVSLSVSPRSVQMDPTTKVRLRCENR